MKRCPAPQHEGNRELPLEAFAIKRSARDGRQGWCRACIQYAKRHPKGRRDRRRRTTGYVNCRIPVELWRRVTDAARARGMSRSLIVAAALKWALDMDEASWGARAGGDHDHPV